MALKVWLPLNGTLENQGLSSLVPSGTPTFLNNGKMGKCISLTPRVSFTGLPKLEKFTILFWLKVDSCSSDWADSLGFTSKQTDGSSAASFRFEATKTTRACSFHNNTPYAITTGSRILITEEQKGEWHHCGFSYDGEHCYTYIDGVLTYTDTGLGGYLIDYFHIGETNNMVGGMNDLRIYDECLSQKQIKEIAKGLCAHYKLEGTGANPNLLENTKTFEGWSVGSGWIKTIENDGTAIYSFSRTGATTNTWVRLIPTYHIVPSNFPNGVAVSFDFMIDDLNALNKQIICALQNYNDSGTRTSWVETNGLQYYINGDKVVSGQWIRLTKLWTQAELSQGTETTYSTLSFQLVQNGSIHIKNIKCEAGNAPTNYIPNSADAAYTALGYDNMIARDVSGNGYNGTISGTLSYNIDSPRYAGSTKFNGSSYITTTSGSLAWCNFDNLTISAWMKPIVKPGGWTGSIGIQQDGGTNGKVFSISNYAGNFSVHTDNGSGWVTTQSEALPLNQWSHCVATLSNGTNLKMYINGKLVKTATINYNTATVLSDTRIAIGVDLPGDDEKYTGYYSDARFYSTALSAEDILKLYEISGIIDNKGNVYAYEFKEE